MTVSSTENRKTFVGNGVTVAFGTSPVVFFDAADLTVYKVVTATGAATLQVLNTDYTVAGGDGSTGTVTAMVAPAVGETYVIVRDLDLTQEVDFVNNEATDAEVAETALDRQVMVAQQLSARIDRSFVLSDSDVSGADTTIPTPEASKFLGWNAGGTALVNYSAADIDLTIVSAFMATFLDDSDATAARDTLSAAKSGIITGSGLTMSTAKLLGRTTASSGAVEELAIASVAGNSAQDFRLSLTTALPVTTSDVTGAGTLYAVPYKGKYIDLYDGTNWNRRASAEFSLALTLTSGKPYDVFCYDNAGVPTLEVLVWTNDSTRATALARQDGVLVKSGDATRRYMGSLYATGSNTTEDSLAKRNLWNYYHRVPRAMRVVEATNSWTYNAASFRQANAAAANQLECMVGVSEDTAKVAVKGARNNAGGGSGDLSIVGIGLDSTTVNSAHVFTSVLRADATGGTTEAQYAAPLAAGRHTLVWLEFGDVSSPPTFYGDNGGAQVQTGISGEVFA